jgi:hypothetical protein
LNKEGVNMMALKATMLLSATALVAGLAVSGPVRADDASVTSMFGGNGAVANSDLAAIRGMENTYQLDADMQATLEDNSATDYGSVRTNNIDASAFAGASGVATVIQNSGDNVIIQTATMVTVNYY